LRSVPRTLSVTQKAVRCEPVLQSRTKHEHCVFSFFFAGGGSCMCYANDRSTYQKLDCNELSDLSSVEGTRLQIQRTMTRYVIHFQIHAEAISRHPAKMALPHDIDVGELLRLRVQLPIDSGKPFQFINSSFSRGMITSMTPFPKGAQQRFSVFWSH
jgi:hypothetical protein